MGSCLAGTTVRGLVEVHFVRVLLFNEVSIESLRATLTIKLLFADFDGCVDSCALLTDAIASARRWKLFIAFQASTRPGFRW